MGAEHNAKTTEGYFAVWFRSNLGENRHIDWIFVKRAAEVEQLMMQWSP